MGEAAATLAGTAAAAAAATALAPPAPAHSAIHASSLAPPADPQAGPEPAKGPAMSTAMRAYFDSLHAETMRCYAIAKQARRQGKDPTLDVEIPPAEDLAARVEAQVGPPGVAALVRRRTLELGNREVVSLRVAEEVADATLERTDSKEKALDQAVRTGLSILTEGVLVAPLEGIAEVKIGSNGDGTSYVDLFFAGPIRAAGGTAQAMAVLIADLVRRKLGIGRFVATDAEVERYKEEIASYKVEAHLQYNPTGPEIELIARSCPVCINGEGTERSEVTGNRDLPRVETNQLRGGACLVMAEGMILKAPKILKHVEALKLEGWEFLHKFVKKEEKRELKPGEVPDIPPNVKFIKEIIAGRPVFAHPSRVGGFRLRYGRARTSGLAANAFHPATMAVLDDFLAVGTQLKVERPGKGTLATPCSSIEGPTVLLRNGSLLRLHSVAEAKEHRSAIAEIVDVGEILIPFGEFAENNHLLPEASWCTEWWRLERAEKVPGPPPALATGRAMVADAEATGAPLHPDGTLLWHDLALPEMRELGAWVLREGAWDGADGGALVLPAGPETAAPKDLLVRLLALHKVEGGRLRIEESQAYPLLRCLGLDLGPGPDGERVVDTPRRRILFDPCQPDLPERHPTVELSSRLAGFKVMPRAPCRIGGRMGRPEKADERVMKTPVHGLFPVGPAGGTQRLIRNAAEAGTIQVEVGERACVACGRTTWRITCDCGGHTAPRPKPKREGFGERPLTDIPVRAELERAKANLKVDRLPDVLKGVTGLMSVDKVPEPLEKAILRAKHGLTTYKDGTVRFDLTDVPLTHFRPKEVGTPVARLRELGYTTDTDGAPLERDDQLLELKVQDVVLADSCLAFFLKASQYLDDLLVRFYGLKPYYNCQKKKDVVGHLAIGLAPHTSGGVLCRIVGSTKAQAQFCHPVFHAAKRRNCLHPDTQVFTLNSPQPRRDSLADLFARAQGPTEAMDTAGTEGRAVAGLLVLAADPATGRIEPRAVRRILRVPAPAHLLRFTTEGGRSFTCSPEHRVEVVAGGRLGKRKALLVRPGDALPVAASLEAAAAVEPPTLDLLEEFRAAGVAGLVLRGLGGSLRDWVDGQGGLAAAARALGASPKSLDNFRRRDSFPAELLDAYQATGGTVPPSVRVGVLRDRIDLPRHLPLGSPLLRLAGYYLAEGCARTGAVHQVDIAATEPDIVADLQACARAVFGWSPKPQPTRLTLSGRLVHVLFTRILDLGADAAGKRIGPRLSALPAAGVRDLLSAYFSGDGSVEAGRAHVQCHSVSRGLLQDVAFQLARLGIVARFKTEERPSGGAVRAFEERKGLPPRLHRCHSLSIRSTHAARFAAAVGFTLPRKQRTLEDALPGVRASRIAPGPGDLVLDPVASIETVASDTRHLYDLEVEGHHNFLCGDLFVASNCDGDEDAFMLLLDGLVNFSRAYVPDRRGGLMDLALLLSTRLDPNEVDKEAHNLDVLREYPLAFFRATQRHANPKEVDKLMGLVGGRLGKPEQYEGYGFTHDTPDIADGPAASAYKTLGSMMEKMTAQMELARKIRAVDEADVGARVIGSHLLPDLIGNLKGFSKQAIRCPKCNTKFRRMPLKGCCLGCGNPNLTLTVHEGSVRKYLEVSKQIAIKYRIDPYTHQRILLLERSVESLFQNDKVKKAKLSDFF